MSTPTTTVTGSTKPQIPGEFLPLLTGALTGVTGAQAAAPFAPFAGSNPQQVPQASDTELEQINKILGFSTQPQPSFDTSRLGATGPEQAALDTMRGFSAPMATPGPETTALEGINFLTSGPLGSSPATTAGMDAFKRLIEPTIRQAHALQGNLGGGGFTEDESLGATAAAVPLIQQEIQNRMNVLGPLGALGSAQRGGARDALTAAQSASQAALAGRGASLSEAEAAFQAAQSGRGQAFSQAQGGLAASALPRELQTLQSQAAFADFLRRQALSEQTNIGPLNTFASTMLTPETVSKTTSSGGLLGKG